MRKYIVYFDPIHMYLVSFYHVLVPLCCIWFAFQVLVDYRVSTRRNRKRSKKREKMQEKQVSGAWRLTSPYGISHAPRYVIIQLKLMTFAMSLMAVAIHAQ